jgi:hypothetical protein
VCFLRTVALIQKTMFGYSTMICHVGLLLAMIMIIVFHGCLTALYRKLRLANYHYRASKGCGWRGWPPDVAGNCEYRVITNDVIDYINLLVRIVHIICNHPIY